jgi:hypothetical protein
LSTPGFDNSPHTSAAGRGRGPPPSKQHRCYRPCCYRSHSRPCNRVHTT